MEGRVSHDHDRLMTARIVSAAEMEGENYAGNSVHLRAKERKGRHRYCSNSCNCRVTSGLINVSTRTATQSPIKPCDGDYVFGELIDIQLVETRPRHFYVQLVQE